LSVQIQEASTYRDQFAQRLDTANKLQPVMEKQLEAYDSIIKTLRGTKERIQVKTTFTRTYCLQSRMHNSDDNMEAQISLSRIWTR